jgi:hypothetical protein
MKVKDTINEHHNQWLRSRTQFTEVKDIQWRSWTHSMKIMDTINECQRLSNTIMLYLQGRAQMQRATLLRICVPSWIHATGGQVCGHLMDQVWPGVCKWSVQGIHLHPAVRKRKISEVSLHGGNITKRKQDTFLHFYTSILEFTQHFETIFWNLTRVIFVKLGTFYKWKGNINGMESTQGKCTSQFVDIAGVRSEWQHAADIIWHLPEWYQRHHIEDVMEDSR